MSFNKDLAALNPMMKDNPSNLSLIIDERITMTETPSVLREKIAQKIYETMQITKQFKSNQSVSMHQCRMASIAVVDIILETAASK